MRYNIYCDDENIYDEDLKITIRKCIRLIWYLSAKLRLLLQSTRHIFRAYIFFFNRNTSIYSITMLVIRCSDASKP